MLIDEIKVISAVNALVADLKRSYYLVLKLGGKKMKRIHDFVFQKEQLKIFGNMKIF